MLQQYLVPPKFETTTSAWSKSMSVHTCSEACDSTSADASRSTRMGLGRPVGRRFGRLASGCQIRDARKFGMMQGEQKCPTSRGGAEK